MGELEVAFVLALGAARGVEEIIVYIVAEIVSKSLQQSKAQFFHYLF